jgi:hypothetical protein
LLTDFSLVTGPKELEILLKFREFDSLHVFFQVKG